MRIRVRGIVQGVGYRPFVYRQAVQHGLAGWVKNDSEGVLLEAEGAADALLIFAAALRQAAPPAASVEAVEVRELPVKGETGFRILPSPAGESAQTLISPDLAICEDCRRELLSPSDRRYRYAFINCTNCGPRYSIIRSVPYDRPRTTMAEFAMCADCQREYEDPADRRFHAQPDACGVCGPQYQLLLADGTAAASPGEASIRAARELVQAGKIVAVKGIGGYHLACDARNAAAVARLRERKAREDKPLAVMAGSLALAQELCAVSAAEEHLLTSATAPIVLLKKRPAAEGLAPLVAPGNAYLGVMLPYAPIHLLLLAETDVWVMTSANRSEEPIAYEDADARQRLMGIADAFLVHNRRIESRVDDSVVRIAAGARQLLRRSRGFAPAPLRLTLPMSGPELSVLAAGAELKNTFCLTKGSLAFVSEHIGDLANQATLASYVQIIRHYEALFSVRPALLACDLHPDYLSTQYSEQRAKTQGLPLVRVQHHYAHIASVLAEHGEREPVLGVAFDGTGWGTDGTIWGGEFLLADLHGFTRLAHIACRPLPGGERAAREPWRQALWVLQELYGDGIAAARPDFTAGLPPGWELLPKAAAHGVNAPLSSSAGRLFDTAAALLGVRTVNHYEGQAAVELEQLARCSVRAERVLGYEMRRKDGMIDIDFLPALQALSEGAAQEKSARAGLALDFHASLAAAAVEVLRELRCTTGISRVALSGGVFQNRLLLEMVAAALAPDFTVLLNRQVPPNDGGISFGQAAVALARQGQNG